MIEKLRVIEYDTIGSTNTEAKQYAMQTDLRDPVLFIAKEQSAGRGRLGRSFLSRRGEGIFMSLLYFTDSAACDAIGITTAAAVIVAQEIEEATGNPTRIKWVNDIYNSCGKVAGILTEAVSLGDATAIVVGIGINVGDVDFPDELKGIAASIGEITTKARDNIIYSVAKRLLCYSKNHDSAVFMDEYRSRDMLKGEYVELFRAGESIGFGYVIGIDDSGGLEVLLDGEEKITVIRTGEVSARSQKR